LAPLEPTSPEGEFLQHILGAEPHLFEDAVDSQLQRLSVEARTAEETAGEQSSESTDLVLYRRIEEVKRMQRQRTVQDLMYASVLHKFVELGVDLLPPLDGSFEIRGVDLNLLTKGVHTPEALEMVKEHLGAVLGGPGAPPPFSNALMRISKLQGAQVYAASIMFGYFVRRVDRTFQLERSLGVSMPRSAEESVAALEELFASAAAADSLDAAEVGPEIDIDPDRPAEELPGVGREPQKGALRAYVEAFDAETLAQTATIVSKEGLALAERQTGALFGTLEELQREMQQAVEELSGGNEISSADELLSKVREAVETGKVDTLTLPYNVQRRIVLEAVAFGAFLRDTEQYVDEYALLTPLPAGGPPPPGLMG